MPNGKNTEEPIYIKKNSIINRETIFSEREIYIYAHEKYIDSVG